MLKKLKAAFGNKFRKILAKHDLVTSFGTTTEGYIMTTNKRLELILLDPKTGAIVTP